MNQIRRVSSSSIVIECQVWHLEVRSSEAHKLKTDLPGLSLRTKAYPEGKLLSGNKTDQERARRARVKGRLRTE